MPAGQGPDNRGTVSISLILVADRRGRSPYKRVSEVTSGHAAGHQAHEVAGPGIGLQPRVRRPRGLRRPNQPSMRLVEAETAGWYWLRTNN